jgi:hypothetical protein
MEDYPMNNYEFMDEMVQRLGTELKELLRQVGHGQLSVAAVEAVVRGKMWHFGAQISGALLEEADEALVAGQAVHDRRTRTVVTLFGPVDVTRSRCQNGRYPLDEQLGLQGRAGWTAAVQEAVSLVACECGFETVSDVIGRLMGLAISPPRVQEVAQRAGQRAIEHKRDKPLDAVGTAAGKTLIIASDGCQAPQRDGWHEVKVATVYVNESRVKTAGGRGKVLQKQYVATLENADGFGHCLRQCAQQWHIRQAKRVVMMGDGAPWIWNLSADRFPQAIEIVDFYHAVEHLWSVGEALCGDRSTSTATRSWVRHNRRQLKSGRVDLVLASMKRFGARLAADIPSERAAVIRRNIEYFQTNRHRMQYDRYRRLKLPIGTGMVEGSCKFVVQSRFKRVGSRWSQEGLRKMLELKLMRLNHHWETLWPHLKAG